MFLLSNLSSAELVLLLVCQTCLSAEIILFIVYLIISPVKGQSVYINNVIPKEDKTPIVMVVPGLTSDSNSPVSFKSELVSIKDYADFIHDIIGYIFVKIQLLLTFGI